MLVKVLAEVRTKIHPRTGHPSGGGTPCSGPQIKSRHQRFSTVCDSREQLHSRHQPGCLATGREGQRAGLRPRTATVARGRHCGGRSGADRCIGRSDQHYPSPTGHARGRLHSALLPRQVRCLATPGLTHNLQPPQGVLRLGRDLLDVGPHQRVANGGQFDLAC